MTPSITALPAYYSKTASGISFILSNFDNHDKMQLLAKFKIILYTGFRATLKILNRSYWCYNNLLCHENAFRIIDNKLFLPVKTIDPGFKPREIFANFQQCLKVFDKLSGVLRKTSALFGRIQVVVIGERRCSGISSPEIGRWCFVKEINSCRARSFSDGFVFRFEYLSQIMANGFL